jgi:hypothetical protein
LRGSAWKARWECALDESLTMVPMVDIDWRAKREGKTTNGAREGEAPTPNTRKN